MVNHAGACASWSNSRRLHFYGVLAIAAIIGAVIYSISMESSGNGGLRKEQIIAALSAREGPVAS